jgi:hypothetical protein
VTGSNPISAAVNVSNGAAQILPPVSKAAHHGFSLLTLLSLGFVGIVVVPLSRSAKNSQRKTVQILSLLVLAEFLLGAALYLTVSSRSSPRFPEPSTLGRSSLPRAQSHAPPASR